MKQPHGDVKKNRLDVANVDIQLDKEENCCWICFEPCTPETKFYSSICSCTNNVHELCLNKWRYKRRGTQDEVICRLCEKSLPTLDIKEVNVLMSEGIIGAAVVNLGYEYFVESIKNIYRRYGIKSHRFMIHITCKVDNHGFKVYKGFHRYNRAVKHTILFIHIRDINEC